MFESVFMCSNNIFHVVSWNKSLNVITYKRNNKRYKDFFFQVLVTAAACKYITGKCFFVLLVYTVQTRNCKIENFDHKNELDGKIDTPSAFWRQMNML
jgi:hypothetical protein